LDIIVVYTREIIGSYIRKSCKSKDFIPLEKQAILWQESITKVMITDNGSQFSAIETRLFFEKLGIIQEFDMRHHPDSQPQIEAQHANVQRKFIRLNTFSDSKDFHSKYEVYMDFYHNLRPHTSLKHITPSVFKELSRHGKIQTKRPRFAFN
jgi:transposase InsO family protein